MTYTKKQSLTFTVEEVSELLGISRGTAYAAVKTGALPSVRLGYRILIPRVAIERLLNGTAEHENSS